jgi:hypothetical protein
MFLVSCARQNKFMFPATASCSRKTMLVFSYPQVPDRVLTMVPDRVLTMKAETDALMGHRAKFLRSEILPKVMPMRCCWA